MMSGNILTRLEAYDRDGQANGNPKRMAVQIDPLHPVSDPCGSHQERHEGAEGRSVPTPQEARLALMFSLALVAVLAWAFLCSLT